MSRVEIKFMMDNMAMTKKKWKEEACGVEIL
jgi:hypothetical protein